MIQKFPTAELRTTVRNFSVRLSSTPRGARLARLLAAEQLRSWGLPLHPAEHIVAELATNAVTHGRVPGRDFRVTVYVVGDTLRIEVTDTRGDDLPRVRHTTADDETGRGLLVVEALADRWGTAPGLRPRKTVWAEITLPPGLSTTRASADPHTGRTGPGHARGIASPKFSP
ncbi:ATP-binding protein [Streptomyces sp. NPDC085946]|uniref:ATP-binding protein n=1 Tax=Streptomyces sp. NPDC085946 TaxID=3365744 RepID=UPI0037D2EAC5